MNEQAQSEFVHPLALGEGECFANKTTEALTPGVVPAFDVTGLASAFAGAPMRASGENLVVSQPEVAAGGPAAVRGRDALAQGPGAVGRTIPYEEGDDLAGLVAKRDPHPAHVSLGADKAPEFGQLQHVARLGRQKRVAQRRQVGGLFSSQPVMVLRPMPKTRAAARRLRRSVATAQSTSSWRAALARRFLGCKTRHAPQARQRNCWRPQAFLPFLTMRSLPQRVQRGAACATREDVFATLQHRRCSCRCHLPGNHCQKLLSLRQMAAAVSCPLWIAANSAAWSRMVWAA